MTKSPGYCPLCGQGLVEKGEEILIADVFKAWISLHQFSPEVVRQHAALSPSTRLYQCSGCALEIFLPPVIGQPSFYRELQQDARFAYYRDDKWDFREAVKDTRGCQAVMEIGCGPGNFLALVKPRLRDVRGIETNRHARNEARAKGLTVYGDEYDPRLLAGSFDAVFSFHVLEHVADPLAFIEQMLLLAKPDGKICISVPDQDGPLRHLGRSVMNMPPHHATRWRLKTFRALANRLNLRVARVAREPLLLENQNYYSDYWLHAVMPGNAIWQRKMRAAAALLMSKFFALWKRLGCKRFVLLRGQAIYVVMHRRSRRTG